MFEGLPSKSKYYVKVVIDQEDGEDQGEVFKMVGFKSILPQLPCKISIINYWELVTEIPKIILLL